MPLTRQQEREIYPILDAALDLAPGKGILHKCTAQRAEYLTRMIQGVRYDSAIESIEMYKPTDPLYGVGSYANLWVEPHDQGLLATNLPSPPANLMWGIIQCAATKQSIPLKGANYNTARQRLARAQKKYPELLNPIYITDGVLSPIANYGKAAPEELLIVDIDRNPKGTLYSPTSRDEAVASQTSQKPSEEK